MNANLSIQLSEHTLTILAGEASAIGKTPSELASNVVECVYGGKRAIPADVEAARIQFESCFGSVNIGHPIGIANEEIDADLAREYTTASRST